MAASIAEMAADTSGDNGSAAKYAERFAKYAKLTNEEEADILRRTEKRAERCVKLDDLLGLCHRELYEYLPNKTPSMRDLPAPFSGAVLTMADKKDWKAAQARRAGGGVNAT